MMKGIITTVVETTTRYALTVSGKKYLYYDNDRQLFPARLQLSESASRKKRVFFKGMHVSFSCAEGSNTIQNISVDTTRFACPDFTKDFSKYLCTLCPSSLHPCIKTMTKVTSWFSCILNALSAIRYDTALIDDLICAYKILFARMNDVCTLKTDILYKKKLVPVEDYIIIRCIKKIVDTPDYSYEKFRQDPYKYLSLANCNSECSKSFLAIYMFGEAYSVDQRCHLNGVISNALYYTMSQGNTCCPMSLLAENIELMSQKLLPECKLVFTYDDILNELNANDSYYIYEGKAMFKWMYYREKAIAIHVNDRVNAYHSDANSLSFSVDDYIDVFQVENSITLNKKQRTAVKNAFVSTSGIFVLTGLPGTGKTSVIRCIEYIANAEEIVYEMASPTGKSAIKMGRKAMTIHRLLSSSFDGHGFKFLKNEKTPLTASLFIFDEVSMMDIELFYSFIKACPPACMIVLIGDNNQLPSVKCGDMLGSLIRSGSVPHVQLTKLYRQGPGSHIPLVAKKVNDGVHLTAGDLNNESIKFIHATEEAEVHQHVLDFYRANKNKYKSKILAPNNNVVRLLNADIHLDEYDTSDPMFESGEEIMCVENEYAKNDDGSVDIDASVLNGEFATFREYTDGGCVQIEKLDDLKCKIIMKVDHVRYGYCITIHKSQGDEYDSVLLVLFKPPYIMLNKNLLYTAITRAKTHLTIIGTIGYLNKCVDVSLSRCDILESLIRELRDPLPATI